MLVPGRGKVGGHWSEGSVLGAKANKGIHVPVVKLDVKKGAESETLNAAGNDVEEVPVLGRPGPVCASIHDEGHERKKKAHGAHGAHGAHPGAGKRVLPTEGEAKVENKIPLETGKFVFRPSTVAMAAKVKEAEERGEWVEVCNLHECFIEQDFFCLSRETTTGTGVVLRQNVQNQKPGKPVKSGKPGKQDSKSDVDGSALVKGDRRGVFKVRIIESESSFKKVESSLLLMQQAKKGIAASTKRRQGGKVMYDIVDHLSPAKDANRNPHSPYAPSFSPSPVRGGEHFTRDLRVRTMASLETKETTTFRQKDDSSQSALHYRYKVLFGKIDAEPPKGFNINEGRWDLVEKTKAFKYEPTEMEFVRDMDIAVPKLHASEFKLKAKRMQELETMQYIEAKQKEEADKYMTREDYDEMILNDDTEPLTDIQQNLLLASSMQCYGKIVENDKQVKQNLRRNKGKESNVVASISVTSTIVHSVPMSRQPTRDAHSRQMNIPEVDVLGGRGGGALAPQSNPNRRASALQQLQQQQLLEQLKKQQEQKTYFGGEWEGAEMDEYHL